MNYSYKTVSFLLLISLLYIPIFSCKHPKPKLKVLRVNTTEHYFSSLKTKDVFKLTLKGDSILTGQITFEIFNHNKKRIFADTFSGSDLSFMDDTVLTILQQEDTVKKRMNDFFAESNFKCPAATDADSAYLPDDHESYIDYLDIKSDTSAIGFYYFYGYEGNYNIAYSKKKKKVVTYLSYD